MKKSIIKISVLVTCIGIATSLIGCEKTTQQPAAKPSAVSQNALEIFVQNNNGSIESKEETQLTKKIKEGLVDYMSADPNYNEESAMLFFKEGCGTLKFEGCTIDLKEPDSANEPMFLCINDDSDVAESAGRNRVAYVKSHYVAIENLSPETQIDMSDIFNMHVICSNVSDVYLGENNGRQSVAITKGEGNFTIAFENASEELSYYYEFSGTKSKDAIVDVYIKDGELFITGFEHIHAKFGVQDFNNIVIREDGTTGPENRELLTLQKEGLDKNSVYTLKNEEFILANTP